MQAFFSTFLPNLHNLLKSGKNDEKPHGSAISKKVLLLFFRFS